MATIQIAIPALRTMISNKLLHIGYNAADATIITDTLIYAELRGNNQGLIKLVSGALLPTTSSSSIETVHETPVSARLKGNDRCGMVVVSSAVDIAIHKAKTSGIGIVGCSNYASATGALGHWAAKIAKENLIGVVMSQCNEMVAPHGSYEPIFGTNPIAIGIPTLPRPQVLDMATSASAWFGLVTAANEGESIRDDIAYDSTGHPTTDPVEAMKGALRVFDRSFKGSHLALMVELLAGAWTGAAMTDKENSKNWGSLVMAIDPNIVAPIEEFQARAAVMCDRVKNAKRLPGEEDKEIYLPGERGDRLAEERVRTGLIDISKAVYSKMEEFL
jgi:L-2-hydroxycarboxylate dehydrogenase (NAD+)